MSALRFKTLDPAGYRRTPWKNGGGVAIDIVGEYLPGADPAAWDSTIWRLGRTAIITSAPFSDLSGFERLQVVVEGRGLVLQTPDGEIDLRQPFAPVRYGGEVPIVSKLEAGPVEVVNLIAKRGAAVIDLQVTNVGVPLTLKAGLHIFHAAAQACELRLDGEPHRLAEGHSLQVQADQPCSVEGLAGRAVVASVRR